MSHGTEGAGTREHADQDFRNVTGYIDGQPLESGLTLLSGYRNQFDALETKMLARNTKENGASNRNNEALLGRSGKSTRRENKKRAIRAAAVSENPDLGDDLNNGDLGTDQLDAIASGSAKTGGAAAKDQTLIEKVKKANPDDANKIVRDFVDDYKSPGEHETIRKRLRRLRKVTQFWTDRDTKALLIEGDDHSIDEIIEVMDQGANDLYHKDGATEGQRRTRDQRNYDALHQAITGEKGNPPEPEDAAAPAAGEATESDFATEAAGTEDTEPKEPNGAAKPDTTVTSNTTVASDRDATADSEAGNKTGSATKSKPAARSGPLTPTLHLSMTIEDFLAGSPEAMAIDGSRLPQSVLDRYMCDILIIGEVFDRNGQVLWHGREVRDPTPAQRSAVIARDGGCQICPAGATGLHVHHILPWNAPAKGKTDIENLVGLCTDCHIWVHENKLTLYKNADGVWKTRAATLEETPPARPQQTKQRRRPHPKTEPKPRTATSDPPPDGRSPPNGNAPPETEQPPPHKPKFILRYDLFET